MTAANHQQLIGGRCLQCGETREVSKDLRRSGLHMLIRRFQARRQIGFQRPQINTVRMIKQRR
ncbi:hypothetical protein D3C73_1652340 [compost metagenome]